MKYFNATQVCNQLNISPSTLRKYAKLFESLEYQITKTSTKGRAYSNEDISMLREFINLREEYPKATNEYLACQLLNVFPVNKNLELVKYTPDIEAENNLKEVVQNQRIEKIEERLNFLTEKIEENHQNQLKFQDIVLKNLESKNSSFLNKLKWKK